MVRVKVRVICIVTGLAMAGMAACGTVATVDSKGYRVGGQVHGLWAGSDGVALRLEADGVNALLTIGNGTFVFDRQIASGASFTVTVAASPPNHACAIADGGNGVISDRDAGTVSVACTGP